jgi:hypothetical protein
MQPPMPPQHHHQQQQQQQQQRRRHADCSQRQYSWLVQPTCYLCGDRGHEAASCACPVCAACGKVGHETGLCDSYCSKCGKGHPGGGCRQCRLCGMYGHISTVCCYALCEACNCWGHTPRVRVRTWLMSVLERVHAWACSVGHVRQCASLGRNVCNTHSLELLRRRSLSCLLVAPCRTAPVYASVETPRPTALQSALAFAPAAAALATPPRVAGQSSVWIRSLQQQQQ